VPVRWSQLKARGSLRGLSPFVILSLMSLAMALLPQISSYEVVTAHIFDVMQNFGTLGLVALALGLTIIAGEFDLSVSSMYVLGGMVAVLTGAHSPVLGVLAALGVGVVVGAVQGGLVAALRMSSMPITLGGYLVLVGLTYTISHNKSVAYSNYDVGLWLDNPIAQVFSPRSLISVALFVVAALVMRYTRIGRDVRAIGGDRRASRTAGVRVDRILIGVFVVAAVASALPGALLDYSLASASPQIGLDQLTFSATAALLGGVSLSGGRGSPAGIAAGVLSLSILQELLVIIAAPMYVSSLITGGLLLAVTIAWAPGLGQWLRTFGFVKIDEDDGAELAFHGVSESVQEKQEPSA